MDEKTLKEKAIDTYIWGRHNKVPGYFSAASCFERACLGKPALNIDELMELIEDLIHYAAASGMLSLTISLKNIEVFTGAFEEARFPFDPYVMGIEGMFSCQYCDRTAKIKTFKVKSFYHEYMNFNERMHIVPELGHFFEEKTGLDAKAWTEYLDDQVFIELFWLDQAEANDLQKMVKTPLGYEAYLEGVPIEDILA